MSARRTAALPSSVLTISSLLLTVLGGGVGAALGSGAADAVDPDISLSAASNDGDADSESSEDGADSEDGTDSESTDPDDLFVSERGADAVLNVESPLISLGITAVEQMEAQDTDPTRLESPEGTEGTESRDVEDLAAVTLVVDGVEDLEGDAVSFTVMTSDMIEPDTGTADVLGLNKWMVIERPLPAEYTEGDYSWVWDQDVLAHGDFTEDMFTDELSPSLSADDGTGSGTDEPCIDVYVNGSPCDEDAGGGIIEDNENTVSIDFAEHVESEFGDTLGEPGEYALVATGDKPGLGHIFGMVEIDLEESEGGYRFSSSDVADEGLSVSVRSEDTEDTDDIESEEYWTDERMENAKPQPMPTVEDEDRALNIWTVGTTVIALLVVAALIALLYWQRLPYRRVRHVEEADKKE